jgi:hypothetical protein
MVREPWTNPERGNFSSLFHFRATWESGEMKLTDEAFAEFRDLWRQMNPDDATSEAELRQAALRLLRAMDILVSDVSASEQLPSTRLSTPVT